MTDNVIPIGRGRALKLLKDRVGKGRVGKTGCPLPAAILLANTVGFCAFLDAFGFWRKK